MNEIIEVIVTHVSTWLPSLAAVITIILGVVPALMNLAKALANLKNHKELIDLSLRLDQLSNENRELAKANRLLIDKIVKIEGYTDSILKE